MIVGGEEGLRPHGIVEMLHDRPGQTEPIEGAGASPDFIQHDEAPRRGIVEDVRGLAHLHHEGRLPAGQIVARSDAGKDPIHQIDARGLGGNIRTGMRQHGQKGHLWDACSYPPCSAP